MHVSLSVDDLSSLSVIIRVGKKKGDMQTCLFSATLSPRIEDVISRFSPKSQLINLNVDLQPPSQGTLQPLSVVAGFALMRVCVVRC
jgi:superfamily II DNA/RNA helicase